MKIPIFRPLISIPAWNDSEYLPLDEAVNLVLGKPYGTPIEREDFSWILWSAAISAISRWNRNDVIWDVHLFWDGSRNFIHVGDFLKWTFQIYPDLKYKHPDELARDIKRLNNSLDHPHNLSDKQDMDKESILVAEDLLRRYKAVGIFPEQPTDSIKEHTDKDFEHNAKNDQPLSNKSWRNNPESDLSEKQMIAISEEIKSKNWAPLELPRGGKKAIRTACESNYPELFKPTSFLNAWKQGLRTNPPKWRMLHYASHVKRGND
ncbi:MAG: hypothetical protein KZQ96_11430 [Candidatus Thiodiazotropha sp. (ex Lucinoma borealis)]|nr:hypothetical protein [Candidatus Thiodiazotropha sp. (ex Lucinoma borealis)]